MKDRLVYMVPDFIPEPYRGYIEERNGNIAEKMADEMGIMPVALIRSMAELQVGDFLLPSKMVSPDHLEGFDVNLIDLYGVFSSQKIHGDKICLHGPVAEGAIVAEGFPSGFAKDIQEAVLPGYAVFDGQDCMLAYDRLRAVGHRVLLKNPQSSDFDGQYAPESREDLEKFLSGYGRRNLHFVGLVVEALVREPVTTSYGLIHFEGETYTMVAEQFDIYHEGRMKFGGGGLQILRGNRMDELSQESNEARQANIVLGAYANLVDKATRYSVDVVAGKSATGEVVSGVTDITARPGGFTPGEMLAINRLRETGSDSVRVQVVLDYNPGLDVRGEVFLDTETLRITAEILE